MLESAAKKRQLTRKEHIKLMKLQRKFGDKNESKWKQEPEPDFVEVKEPPKVIEKAEQVEPTEDDFVKMFGGMQDFGSTKNKDHTASAAEATYKQFIQ